MAPLIYPATKLDSDQVIQYVYDEATQTLRTTATAVIVGQPIEVEIDMATDSIKLGDGTTLFTSTTVGPKTGLDVSIINTIPISGSITVTNFPNPVDTNYGVVGASTIRTAAQIGNATGAANFDAGITTPQTLRVVLPTDQTAIPATQSGTWNINNITGTISLPTGASTAANQTNGSQQTQVVDGSGDVWGPRTGSGGVNWFPVINLEGAADGAPVAPRTLQIGGSDGVNLQTLSTDTSGFLNVNAFQGTSPWIVSGTVVSGNDTNYGVVGANTLRTAAQIGNATGAALFGAGTTTAQVLRVVLPTDQTAIPVSDISGDYAPTATLTQVGRTNVSTTLKAANANRKGLILVNDSNVVCYVAFAGTSSSAAYTVRLTNNESVSLDKNPIYTGIVTGIWTSNGSGSMLVTELT